MNQPHYERYLGRNTMPGNELDGHIGVVTGGGSGIGRQTTLTLAAAGATVIALDLDGSGLDETAGLAGEHARRVRTAICDVSDEASFHAAVMTSAEGRDPLFLVNAAGIEGPMSRLVDTTIDDWDRVLRVNLRGSFVPMKSLLPAMIVAGEGSIVNLASVASFGGAGELSAYTASKHAVVGLTRAAVAEVARSGVRINAIGPGPTRTPLQTRAEQNNADPEMMRSRQIEAIPQGRYGEPEEIADLILFLVSDRSTYVNGALIAIDGGMTATL
ncbi:3alpha(or 20beta)-hydroxysteroid dehydrogenase [Arthrobacter sp. GAS37]|uniref:SDR family NAD(P)-dependent oxidoreductase n=1 Tax=Arthrobacter sp. GAS37 TaxID=3156261 RepID=UPI003839C1EA